MHSHRVEDERFEYYEVSRLRYSNLRLIRSFSVDLSWVYNLSTTSSPIFKKKSSCEKEVNL